MCQRSKEGLGMYMNDVPQVILLLTMETTGLEDLWMD